MVVEEAQAPGGVELHDIAVEVITPVTERLPFPINKRVLKVGLDTFLDNATVGLSNPT
jgi:aspartyl/asparaginyl-tRNA synthetase